MQFLGLTIARTKSLVPVRSWPSLFGYVRESFAGAWQRNVVVDNRESLLAFSAVFSCVWLIASSIAKLRIRLVELDSGIWNEVLAQSPFWTALRKPNDYQNRIQFIVAWVISKLLYGNTYVLKERDQRGVVNAMHVLDPRRVTPLVDEEGSVYYQLGSDPLAGIGSVQNTVLASEIIHDRGATLFHPLVGVSPIFACAAAGTQGNRIQANSSQFFENMSRPSGVITSPHAIPDDHAARIKTYWEENFQSSKIGRLAVLGDGMHYEAMTIPAADAQLIEQLKWTVEDVARAFNVPLYKINSGPMPTNNNVEALQQQFYSDCLQVHIESVELCLDEGMSLPVGMGTEFDLDGLLRMDTATMYDALGKAIGAGFMAPNEARAKVNLKKVKGGEVPFLQEQNWPIGHLSEREIPTREPTAPAATPAAPANDEAKPDDEAAADEMRELIEHIQKGLACATS